MNEDEDVDHSVFFYPSHYEKKGASAMLTLRVSPMDWLSALVYRLIPLPEELQRIKDLFPDETIVQAAQPYYDLEQGCPSEDPRLLTKILFLSFFFAVEGDNNTLQALTYRLDWRQFCGLSLLEKLPARSTLVTFRRRVGPAVIETLFTGVVETLREEGLISQHHRFFDGTPAKARANINPYRDDIYEAARDTLAVQEASSPSETVELPPVLNPSPVQLTKHAYPVDDQAVRARRTQPMKPVAARQSAGDPDAHFQRGKHGKPSTLGYEIFFSTDSEQLFIETVDVSAKANQGTTIFEQKLEESHPGQEWSVDGEFPIGEILAKAEEKQVILHTPARPESTTGMLPKSVFVYQAESDTYQCPNQQTLLHVSTNRKTEAKTYRGPAGTCEGCPFREQCTTAKTGRSITRSKYAEQYARQREHAKTPEAVMGRVLRGIVAEGKFGEAVRHGLKKMRYVGKTMAVMQSHLVAAILNFKRFLRVRPVNVLA
jgi:transposase